LSVAAKQIKLGDKICNTRDVVKNPPSDWSLQRRREYLDWAERVVAGCRGANEALGDYFDRVVAEGRETLGRAAALRSRRQRGAQMSSVAGKVIVVTGSASGAGKAAVEKLTAEGAKVVIADLQDGSDLAEAIGGVYVKTDVTDEEQVKHLMGVAAALGDGHIHAVINNAGIMCEAAITETTVEMMNFAYRVHAVGVMLGMKHAVGYMQAGGAFVNTSSLGALLALPTYGAYSASKAAVIMLTKIGAIEFGPLGIRVNCICPTSIDTPMLRGQEAPEVELAVTTCASPLGSSSVGSTLDPQDVANLMHFLVSDDSLRLTGQTLALDAGCTAGWPETLLNAAVAAADIE
jgi:3alpha(or 20beta)-hydroxysteroid dehydrogenase